MAGSRRGLPADRGAVFSRTGRGLEVRRPAPYRERDEERSAQVGVRVQLLPRSGAGRLGRFPSVDDRTWADLDMDAVFLRLDRTRSSVGQACLYDLLRRPVRDPAALSERSSKIGALAKDSRARARIGRVLSRLGIQRDAEVFQFLSSIRGTVENRRRYLYLALSIAAVVVIPLVAVFGLRAVAVLVLVAIVNLVLHYRFKAIVTVESPSYEYLFRLLGAAQRLGGMDGEALRAETEALRDLSRSLAKIRRRCGVLMTPTGFSGDIVSLFLEYLRMYFLLEVTAYFFVHNEILHRMKDLSRLYGLVGGIDALVALATLRRETPRHCVPEMQGAEMRLEVEDAVHPLLDEPVANSIRLKRPGDDPHRIEHVGQVDVPQDLGREPAPGHHGMHRVCQELSGLHALHHDLHHEPRQHPGLREPLPGGSQATAPGSRDRLRPAARAPDHRRDPVGNELRGADRGIHPDPASPSQRRAAW